MSKRKEPIHRARKVQVSQLRGDPEPEPEIEYPKPPWWREDVHGRTALEARQEARLAGHLNAPIRKRRKESSPLVAPSEEEIAKLKLADLRRLAGKPA